MDAVETAMKVWDEIMENDLDGHSPVAAVYEPIRRKARCWKCGSMTRGIHQCTKCGAVPRREIGAVSPETPR